MCDQQKTAITTSVQGRKSSLKHTTLLPESESTMTRIKRPQHELNPSPMCPVPVDRRPQKRGFETDTSPDFWLAFARFNDSLRTQISTYPDICHSMRVSVCSLNHDTDPIDEWLHMLLGLWIYPQACNTTTALIPDGSSTDISLKSLTHRSGRLTERTVHSASN